MGSEFLVEGVNPTFGELGDERDAEPASATAACDSARAPCAIGTSMADAQPVRLRPVALVLLL